MRTVWKYRLLVTDDQLIIMPQGAVLLSVQEQDMALTLWAAVKPGTIATQRRIRVIGTGHPLEPGLVYVGTVLSQLNGLVWHVFDGGEL